MTSGSLIYASYALWNEAGFSGSTHPTFARGLSNSWWLLLCLTSHAMRSFQVLRLPASLNVEPSECASHKSFSPQPKVSLWETPRLLGAPATMLVIMLSLRKRPSSLHTFFDVGTVNWAYAEDSLIRRRCSAPSMPGTFGAREWKTGRWT